MTRALLSLGSNRGERERHLRGAVAGIGEAVLVVSGVYESPPWGDPDQPHYLNAAVLAVDPARDATGWLDLAGRLERAAGRVRDPARRFGPRTLDVDVIAVWDDGGAPVVRDDPDLTLPHPRAAERAFVLRPWLDIQPYAQLPGHGRVNDLIRAERFAGDLAELKARDDIDLETDQPTA
jgi:2-amino-4-hydroxy-6-hydroxymethyldihydropteridine diphosphokinase